MLSGIYVHAYVSVMCVPMFVVLWEGEGEVRGEGGPS